MISIIMSCVGVVAAILVLLLIRRDQMHISKAIIWLLVAAGFGFLGLTPSLFDQLATLINVEYPPALALSVALIMIALKLLLSDLELSRLKVRQDRLVQQIAILESDLNDKDFAERKTTPTPTFSSKNQ